MMKQKKAREIVSFFLIVCFVRGISQPFPIIAAEESASLSVAQAYAYPGENVTISIMLDNNPGIAGLKIAITYDAEKLSVSNQHAISKGQALGFLSYIGPNENAFNNNPLTVLWYGTSNDQSTGILINILFTVLDKAPEGSAYVEVICDPGDILNQDEKQIETLITQGSVNIISTKNLDIEPNQPKSTPLMSSNDAVGYPNTDTSLFEHEPQNPEAESKSTVWANPFIDVQADDWFYPCVEYVFKRNLIAGTSASPMLFNPNSATTRGMVVTILHRASGSPKADAYENPFDDVSDKDWYIDAVKWAAVNKIVSGYGNGTFGPENNISRQDLVVILHNYANQSNIPLSAEREYQMFRDDTDISDYAREAVICFFQAGIIGGKPGNLYDPKGGATRAEFASVLMRLLE